MTMGGIPVTEKPMDVTVALDKRGNPIPGRDYHFKDGKIMHEHYSHIYGDDPTQNRGTHFNDIFEFFPLIEKNNMPDLTLICLENFILEYENVNDYLHYINNELNKLKETVFLKKKIYLCMVTKKNVDSSKVIDYYKVWRTVKEKYRIDSFILGYEMKLVC